MKKIFLHRKRIALVAGTVLISLASIFSCTNEKREDPNKEEWLSLFNGKNLDKWTPKIVGYEAGVNHKNTFLVEDSLLKVRYAKQDTFKNEFGHLFYADKYSHYRLRATYRFVGEQMTGGPGWAFRNNGFMLHCQSPQSMGLHQDFPISLEMQLLGGSGVGERSTGNLCTPGTHVILGDSLFTPHCVGSSSKTYHGDQWVEVEALVLGDSLIQHIVEGEVVLEYRNPTIDGGNVSGHGAEMKKDGTPLKEGYISIQSETHPIDFKSIEILDLCGCMDPKAKNYKSYYVKADNSKCIY
ncbi:DUF1080 domain-containing protein [Fulvivirgaceae bacterium BMA10]|uniref:DUF1080 domain-containing protein n=1 Tax=Splendidivirga corallicola TaxID=3051826 RepID=A0ABT8KJ29_9BACT|nr:DUF1080 domain-containing protein [Fulvivirgaceae bacterium BMA10]